MLHTRQSSHQIPGGAADCTWQSIGPLEKSIDGFHGFHALLFLWLLDNHKHEGRKQSLYHTVFHILKAHWRVAEWVSACRMATEARVQAEAEQERQSARDKENARREAEKQKRLQAADKDSNVCSYLLFAPSIDLRLNEVVNTLRSGPLSTCGPLSPPVDPASHMRHVLAARPTTRMWLPVGAFKPQAEFSGLLSPFPFAMKRAGSLVLLASKASPALSSFFVEEQARSNVKL